ncbi:methyltransferase family protein [Herbihabitans rhizosphaerae]|uniref:Methyltransferase family protein n=1 Tax=Herbihabitans rhizosphaerae TaxID=1872711 RepID=A0A4V2ESG7_9PSEU|nr:class I SAM-dependent methyltransferase [Herbihabitans rhizosphaerae]RZS37513.1 methyltransferase family protein [Herbihabitans rhizosphaerae]
MTAFDLDPAMITRARRRLRDRDPASVDLSVGDVCAIDLPDHSVDAVADFGIIHHVPDWRRAIAEVARVLRPGGVLLFEEVPRRVLDSWTFRTFTDHPRDDRFEADDFAVELVRNGLAPTAEIRNRVGGMVFVGAARAV